MVASHTPSSGDLARNPGMCPDWESNRRPFGLQAGAQSIESHQPELKYNLFFKDFVYLFLDKGEWKEKERERNISVWLPLMHPLSGPWPATQACALTGNQPVTLWFAGRH